MSTPALRIRRAVGALALGAVLATGGCGGSISNSVSSAPCGSKSTAMLASVYMDVAERIYNGELHGYEVNVDLAHITGSRELAQALASSNRAAVYAAVHRIVYHRHWHIVRLRVLSGGHVLADVGGPYIIAPVSGTLSWHGRTVGTFVTSVQDDIGYVKLISRFTGVPIDLYRNGAFLMGTLNPAPSSVSDGRFTTVAGDSYEAHVLEPSAFPSGALKAVLFVPQASQAVAAKSCGEVRVLDGWASVVRHIASRYKPLDANYSALVDTLQGSSGGLAYVRVGSRRLAGGSSPPALPPDGIVSYRGRSWSVFSWEPVPPARVYLLTPSE